MCFQLLHGVRKFFCGILFSWSVMAFWIPSVASKFYTLQLQLHLREEEVIGGRQIWRVWGVVQCCDLFLSQRLSNYCCRTLSTLFVSSNLLLKSVEPQFSGCRVYLLLTKTSLFDLLWPFCRWRHCCHWFDLLWTEDCVRRPTLSKPFVPLKNCCST